MFQYMGSSTPLLASSTFTMSTFLALVQSGVGSEDDAVVHHPLNPSPEMIMATCEIDQIK